MCERRVTPGGGRVFACHREHHVLSLRVRVEQARIALLSGDEDEMVAFLRGVSPSDESATAPTFSEGSRISGGPRLVMRPTPWDAEPVECIDLGPYTGPIHEHEPLRLVVCPLGEFCLGDGPTCFAVADAIFIRLALDPEPATIAL